MLLLTKKKKVLSLWSTKQDFFFSYCFNTRKITNCTFCSLRIFISSIDKADTKSQSRVLFWSSLSLQVLGLSAVLMVGRFCNGKELKTTKSSPDFRRKGHLLAAPHQAEAREVSSPFSITLCLVLLPGLCLGC